MNAYSILPGFCNCVYRMVSNPVYLLVVTASCFRAFGSAGLLSFIIKYMETQFYLPTWKANLMLGKYRLSHLKSNIHLTRTSLTSTYFAR